MKPRPRFILHNTSWIVPHAETFNNIVNSLINRSTIFTPVNEHKFMCSFIDEHETTEILVRIYRNSDTDFLIEFQRNSGSSILFNNNIREIIRSLDNGTFRRPLNM